MDDFTIKGKIIVQTLNEIERINRLLGGNSVTIDGLRKLFEKSPGSPALISVADLGCGGGAMSDLVWIWGLRNNLHMKITGFDANPHIIDYCNTRFHNHQKLHFECLDIKENSFTSQRFDIIMATLFIHHFTNEELVSLISQFATQTRIGIVINDLHRHWLAYYAIKIITKLFSKSEMVKYDAPLSVLRGFKKTELIEILKKSGIKNFSIKWKWAFRWQIIIYPTSGPS